MIDETKDRTLTLAAKLVAAGLTEDAAARLATEHANADPLDALAARLAADAPREAFAGGVRPGVFDRIRAEARQKAEGRQANVKSLEEKLGMSR